MKKSFRPTRTSRPSIRPSSPRPSRVKESFSRPKESFSSPKESFGSSSHASGSLGSESPFESKKSGFGGKENFAGTGFNPRRRWGRRSAPLISLVVVIICCLIIACIALIYAFTQGWINLPSF